VAFLKNSRADKRCAKIEELLARPEYAAHWALLWDDLLIGYDAKIRTDSKNALYTWLRDECFSRNLAYDQMVTRLLTARGVNNEFGPVNFLIKLSSKGGGAINMTGRITRIFLGTQIQCAQCHDHPFDRYTQDDFYGMVAFFSRVSSKKVDGKDQKDTRYELLDSSKGEVSYGEGKERKTAKPHYLDGVEPAAGKDRREEFVRLLLRPENLQFSRAAVNRLWAHFFGRGIVDPVDDFSGKYKPSHPEVLDELAREFAAENYDLKWLIRVITNSRTYQLSSRKPRNAGHELYFSYAQTRALSPEQMVSALLGAVGEEAMGGGKLAKPGAPNPRDQMLKQFRTAFGNEDKVDLIDYTGTIPQALLLMNGNTLNQGVASKNNRLSAILGEYASAGDRVNQIFLAILSRMPSERERATYVAYAQSGGNRREAHEDVCWALLNSSEFLFNH
jgi:hypothetical protein